MLNNSKRIHSSSLTATEQKILLNLSRESINYGLYHQEKLKMDLALYSDKLCEKKACFVTLEKNKKLRGCIGSLIAKIPLVQEVADRAFAAAFLDHRFSKVIKDELAELQIYISILTTPILIKFNSEQDLLLQLRPKIDGLILKIGNLSGTFLPSVWEQLPQPSDFLQQLKNKAGLPTDYWSEKIEIYRYETDMFTDP